MYSERPFDPTNPTISDRHNRHQPHSFPGRESNRPPARRAELFLEAVADAADRLDILARLAKFLPQADDLHVDGPILDRAA